MKRNDIPALIVSTPGLGQAPCRDRYGIGLPLLARLGPPKVGHSRADPAVESLAVPVARPPRNLPAKFSSLPERRNGSFVPPFASPPPFVSNEIGSFVP
jgi:hypothetical protein